jgi:hypothetical protein
VDGRIGWGRERLQQVLLGDGEVLAGHLPAPELEQQLGALGGGWRLGQGAAQEGGRRPR